MNENKYYMFHKPFGCVTARRDETETTIMDYVHNSDTSGSTFVESLFPVGRLDKDTEGLLLLTNDGTWANDMMQPSNKIAKTYEFYALGQWDVDKTKHILSGVSLRGQKELFAANSFSVSCIGSWESFEKTHDLSHFTAANCHPSQPVLYGQITISRGIKHQVRRMLRSLGCFVIYLKRVSIGNLVLDDELKVGELRKLTTAEVEQFRR